MKRTTLLQTLVRARKTLLASTLIVLLALSAVFQLFPLIPEASAGGPATPNLLMTIFSDPTLEENALAVGDIDINDWPLSSTFITVHAADPAITMIEYAGIDMFQFDMNNQKWPTGWPGFFDETIPRHMAALHFRRSLSHLSNKDKYTTILLGGLGYVMNTVVPVPALQGFTDYSTLANATAVADAGPGGYLYPYDRAAAIAEFEAGGFHDWDGDTWREWSGDGGTTYEELPNMKFWIRLDDPNRRQAGENLYSEMVAVGIPEAAGTDALGLEKKIALDSTTFDHVVQLRDYNLYTGNWGDDFDLPGPAWELDYMFDLYHSGWADSWGKNYVGFMNSKYDSYAERVLLSGDEELRDNAINAQWVIAEYAPVIPLWASKGVKGYRTGWDGVVNKAGSGIDNDLTLQEMLITSANTIKLGSKSDPGGLNALWDSFTGFFKKKAQELKLIYEGLMDYNPYTLSKTFGKVVQKIESANEHLEYPQDPPRTVLVFDNILTLRSDVLWHGGAPVTSEELKTVLLMYRDLSNAKPNPFYFLTKCLDDITIDSNRLTLHWRFDPARIVWEIIKKLIVDITVKAATDLAKAVRDTLKDVKRWLFGNSILLLDPQIWMAAIGPGTAVNYDPTAHTFGDLSAIEDYHPWEMDANTNGIIDLTEDGVGPWKFESYSPGNSLSFSAFSLHYSLVTSEDGTQMPLSSYIIEAFHEIGNVNYAGGYGETQGWYPIDEKIDLFIDLNSIATSSPSNTASPWGNGSAEFNPDADLNQDGQVNIIDLATAGSNYNKRQG